MDTVAEYGKVLSQVADDIATFLQVEVDERWTSDHEGLRQLAARVIRDVNPAHPDGYAPGVAPAGGATRD